jgi:pSer/pThr/pTyr-binding forkhead associated (FHA) protein
MATLQRLGDEALCPISFIKMRIGRSAENEIIIEDDAVSAEHAQIITQVTQTETGSNKAYVLEDLDSTNHTFVNNNEITSRELVDGDIIKVGTTRLKFSTKEYIPPQDEMQKTRKISGNKISSFLFSK